MLADFGIGRIRNMRLRDQGHCLRPAKRRAFPLAVEWRFVPSVEQVEPFLGLTASPRILRMRVDAIGATVDLRGAGLDELDQRRLEPAVPDIFLELRQRLHRVWSCL